MYKLSTYLLVTYFPTYIIIPMYEPYKIGYQGETKY
jgi:hypothetical protein